MHEFLIVLQSFARELGEVFLVLLGAFLVSRILRRLIDKLQASKSLSSAMADRLQSARKRVILLVVILLLMQTLGIFNNAWAFISAGIAAVALGFVAAWSIVSNATAALLIMTFRPFRIGDSLELLEPSGAPMGGEVVDMNLMYTTLRLSPEDNHSHIETEGDTANHTRVLRVPNNLFFQRVVRLYSPHHLNSKATFFTGEKS